MTEEVNLHRVLDTYLHKLEALHEIFPLVMTMSFAAQKAEKGKHLDFLKKHGKVAEATEEYTRYDLPSEHLRLSARLSRKAKRAATAYDLLPRNFLVSYVSEYDAYLGELIRNLLLLKPEIIDSSEKNISLSDLMSLGSVEAARSHMIEKEVESVLRKSHSEQFNWLEKTFSLTLRKDLEVWPTFIELTERRNLFVHCDGIVSSQYLKVCGNAKLAPLPDIGEQLKVNKGYLNKSYESLYEIGVKLCHVLWRKIRPDDIENAENSLSHVTYELLANEKYSLAVKLLEFASASLKRWQSDGARKIYIVNLAIAYKNSGRAEDCLRIINSEDWSACGDNYQICISVLKDDFEEAVKIMYRIGSDGVVKEADYIEWPAFKVFREYEGFKNAFIKIFGREPILTEEVESVSDDTSIETQKEIEKIKEETV